MAILKWRPRLPGTNEFFLRMYEPLTRYIKLCIADAQGIPGTFSPPPTSKGTASQRSRHASRHMCRARAVMHIGIANTWRRVKCYRHCGTCATLNFTYLVRAPWFRFPHLGTEAYDGSNPNPTVETVHLVLICGRGLEDGTQGHDDKDERQPVHQGVEDLCCGLAHTRGDTVKDGSCGETRFFI